MTPKILTIGTAYMDMLVRLPKLPEQDTSVVVEEGGISYLPDGAGACCAVALSKLGAKSFLLTRLGQDVHGHRLYTTLGERGVDTSSVVVDPALPTGMNVVILEDPLKQRSMLYPGANATLSRADLAHAFAQVPDAICLQMNIPEAVIIEAAKGASERHIPIFLDAKGITREFPLTALPEVEVFSPNEIETEILTGIRPTGSESCLKAVLELVKLVKARYYVIKVGDRGAFISDGRHFNLISPYVVKPVDTAGVGDAFLAGLAMEYLQTRGDLTAACKMANTVSAMTIMRAGTFDAFPTMEEVQAFIARNGVR